jgi:hypothetical protein
LPNYAPEIGTPGIVFVGDSFAVNITTINIGPADATANSITRAVFESNSRNFTVPPLSSGSRQTNSASFTCTSAGLKNVVEIVDLLDTVFESNENDNNQSFPIACYTAPTSCNLSFAANSPPFSTSESALVQATCYYADGAIQTACPSFDWQQNANNSSMSPTNTPAAMLPRSTLVISNADTPQIGRKVAVTTAVMDMSCELPFDISETPVGPDYAIISMASSPIPASLGQTVYFTVRVQNIGNVDAVNNSKTYATFTPGCTPVKTDYDLPPLTVSQINTNSELACTCASPGWQSVSVIANQQQTQWETTFLNNNAIYLFYCQATSRPLVCSDYV